LVTGNVKNWVHTDRSARVIVTVPLPRDTDADAVAQLMRDAAGAHPDVLEDPAPRVLFKTIGDSTLTFDLICFVGEVDGAARVQSDLTFAIFRQLRAKKIIVPAGPPTMEIAGMVELREQVKALQQSMAGRPNGAAPEPEMKGPLP
jgi:potassium efflux system protein